MKKFDDNLKNLTRKIKEPARKPRLKQGTNFGNLKKKKKKRKASNNEEKRETYIMH